jgi:hypothetical protein
VYTVPNGKTMTNNNARKRRNHNLHTHSLNMCNKFLPVFGLLGTRGPHCVFVVGCLGVKLGGTKIRSNFTLVYSSHYFTECDCHADVWDVLFGGDT